MKEKLQNEDNKYLEPVPFQGRGKRLLTFFFEDKQKSEFFLKKFKGFKFFKIWKKENIAANHQ